MRAERIFATGEMSSAQFVKEFDRITLDFQDKMANALKPAEYLTLFDLKPGTKVVLADKTIVQKEFRR